MVTTAKFALSSQPVVMFLKPPPSTQEKPKNSRLRLQANFLSVLTSHTLIKLLSSSQSDTPTSNCGLHSQLPRGARREGGRPFSNPPVHACKPLGPAGSGSGEELGRGRGPPGQASRSAPRPGRTPSREGPRRAPGGPPAGSGR